MMSSYGLLESLWLSMHSVGGSQTGKSKHIKPLKTDMTGWKIPIFNRKYIFKWWMLQPVMLVFFGGKGGKWLKSCAPCAPAPIEPLRSRHHWWLDMIHGPSDEEMRRRFHEDILVCWPSFFWRSLQIPGYAWWGFTSYQRFPRWYQGWFQGPPIMGPPYGKIPVWDSYGKLPISLGILMGLVWEAFHKGVPLLGVPENPADDMPFFLVGSSKRCVLPCKGGGEKWIQNASFIMPYPTQHRWYWSCRGQCFIRITLWQKHTPTNQTGFKI